MNQPNDKHERLEKYIDSVLRAQPDKRAPASLESNVLAAIAQRAARPWWQRSFNAGRSPRRPSSCLHQSAW